MDKKFKKNKLSEDRILDNIMTLSSYYKEDLLNFGNLFYDFVKSNIDCTIKRINKGGKGYIDYNNTTYNRTILMALVIFKFITNSIENNKLTNKDLVFIWGTFVKLNSDFIDETLHSYNNRFNLPEDFSDVVEYKILMGKEPSKIRDYLSLASGNDFSAYINGFKFNQYQKAISDILVRYELFEENKFVKILQKGIESFLNNIKISREKKLTHEGEENKYYSNADNPFDYVFNSNEINKSYYKTWNRFYNQNPKEMELKFYKLIGKKSKKN